MAQEILQKTQRNNNETKQRNKTQKKRKIKERMNMDKKQKEIIEEYQCAGCVCGGDTSCFEAHKIVGDLSCGKHVAGTMATGIGKFFLGMPIGFCRIGHDKLEINIFKSIETSWGYDKFNVPVWKHKNEKGHVFVRGIRPRLNMPFLHIIINCPEFDKIDCINITEKDMDEMD